MAFASQVAWIGYFFHELNYKRRQEFWLSVAFINNVLAVKEQHTIQHDKTERMLTDMWNESIL